jgi:hypothetical protein
MSTGESHATSFADDIKVYTLHDASFADGIIVCLEFENLDKNLTILCTELLWQHNNSEGIIRQ